MKKITIFVLLFTLLASCWLENKDKKEDVSMKKQIHTVLKPKTEAKKTPEQKYWKYLVKYIKDNLSEQEELKLITILKNRRKNISQIKPILLKAQQNWDLKEKFEEVLKTREEIKKQLLPYIKTDKLDAFNKAFNTWNILLKKMFNQ